MKERIDTFVAIALVLVVIVVLLSAMSNIPILPEFHFPNWNQRLV